MKYECILRNFFHATSRTFSARHREQTDQVAIAFCKFCMSNNSRKLGYIEIIFVMLKLPKPLIRWSCTT